MVFGKTSDTSGDAPGADPIRIDQEDAWPLHGVHAKPGSKSTSREREPKLKQALQSQSESPDEVADETVLRLQLHHE